MIDTSFPKWVDAYRNQEFSSGPFMEEDGKQWISSARRWWKKYLSSIGAVDQGFRVGHYEFSLFFRLGEQWWYVSCSDCRFKTCDWLLVRRASGPKDYTGGVNQSVAFDAHFVLRLNHVLGIFQED